MPERQILGVAVRPSRNSVKLVEAVVNGVLQARDAGVPQQLELHLLHVCISFAEADERTTKDVIAFITKWLHPHLLRLPTTCTWHLHVLALRRPLLFTSNDEEMMVAYALIRKAARLNCQELLIKGKGCDPRVLPYLIGHSITHLVLSWSTIPVHLYHPKLGFKLEAIRGNVPRGQDPNHWRASMRPIYQAPVVQGTMVEQPDGSVSAIYAGQAASCPVHGHQHMGRCPIHGQ